MVWGVAVVFAAYLGVRLYEVTEHRPLNQKLRALLRQVSYKKEEPRGDDAHRAPGQDETDRHKRYVKVSGLSVGAAIVRHACPSMTIISILLFTYTAIPYLRQTETSLAKNKKVDGYVLYAIADMMMLWLGALVTAALGIGLLHASKFILSSAKDRSKELVVDAFAKRPRQVWVSREGAEVQVPLDRVQRNDIVIVNTGEVIPVDGIIAEGIAAVDQHALTGESQQTEKSVGDQVYASTLLISW